VVPPSPPPSACEGTAPLAPVDRQVAFVRGGDIWAASADGGTAANLTNTSGATEQAPAWSPDGSRVAFERDGGIFTMVASGVTPPSELTPPGSGDSAPAWSMDGGRIAFVRGGDIWVVAANGGTPDLAVGASLADPLGSPTWSPDACQLAFTWRGGVVRARTDGTGLANVHTDAVEPSWGRSGRLAVSALNRTTREVWLVNPDGANFDRLTLGGGRMPSWSASGTAVAFAASTRANPGIYTQQADGGGLRRVTTDASDTDPAW
jgi:Tol biopolymer transport system component